MSSSDWRTWPVRVSSDRLRGGEDDWHAVVKMCIIVAAAAFMIPVRVVSQEVTWPIPGDEQKQLGSVMGDWRVPGDDPTYAPGVHQGVDIYAEGSTPVVGVKHGYVSDVVTLGHGDQALVVKSRGGFDEWLIYGHIYTDLRRGDEVDGSTIAWVFLFLTLPI